MRSVTSIFYVAEKLLLRHLYFSIEELIFCVAVYDFVDGVFVSCNRIKFWETPCIVRKYRKTEIWRKFES